MCFSPPKQPDPPAVPSRNSEAAQARVAAEQDAARQQQGRAATIVTTPLGDPEFGRNVRRTQIGGF